MTALLRQSDKPSGEAGNFLQALFAAKPAEMWILIWTLRDKRSAWFIDVDAAAQYVRAHAGQDLYVGAGLAARDYGPHHRCPADQTAAIVGLWADIDIAGPAHRKPNLPPNEGAVRELLADCGPAPTLIVHSGHGLQAWWLFHEIWAFDDTAERQKAASLAKRWNDTLRAHARLRGWDVDATGDLARVLRVPGTTNTKIADDPRQVRLLREFCAMRYNPSDFDDWLIDDHPAGGAAAMRAISIDTLMVNPDAEPPFDKLDALWTAEPRFYQSWRRKRPDMQDQSASAYDMSLASFAVSAGWTDQEITDLLVAHRVKHGDDLKRPGYYQLTIGKARQSKAIGGDDQAGASPILVIDAQSNGEASGIHRPLILPEWPEPPGPAAFTGLAGRVLDLISPFTEADPIALLAHFLAAFGNVIDAGPHAQVGATRHSARENFILVGRTSKARKGESWSPIQRLFQGCDRGWALDGVKSGLSSGEGLIWSVRDPIEKKEPVKEKGRYTGEYVEVVVDPGVPDKRLLVLEPEFGRVLRVMTRQANTLSAVIRQAWDTGDLRIMTKVNAAKATGAHISIIGHVTAEELTREIADTETVNGFANRFMWLAVRRSKELPEPAAFESQPIADLTDELIKLVYWTRGIGRLERDDEARELWADVYSDLSGEQPGLAGAILARAEAHVLRLSVLYALLDRSSTVRVEHLQSALELWGYADRSVRFIFGDLTGNPVADTILQALRQNGEMTRTQLSDLFGRHESSARIAQALQHLLTTGKARSHTRETGGRPVEIWVAAQQ